jgi:hypothetical protein
MNIIFNWDLVVVKVPFRLYIKNRAEKMEITLAYYHSFWYVVGCEYPRLNCVIEKLRLIMILADVDRAHRMDCSITFSLVIFH